MPGVRARFVRDVLELVERKHGRESIHAGIDKLSGRIGALADSETLRTTHCDSLPLPETEELLLGLDAFLGEVPGRVLEESAMEVFSRLLGSGGLAVHGDLMATAARLQAPLEHLFVEQHIVFDVAASSFGFSLFLGVPGRPRTARLLRHFATGALRAAQRFARQGMNQDVKITAEIIGDRVRLDVKLKELSDSDSPMPPEIRESSRPPAARRASKPHHVMGPRPTLDAVERIFARASITGIQPSEPPLSRPEAPRRASTPPPRPVTDPMLHSRTPTQPGVRERPATQPRPVERPKSTPLPFSDSSRKASGLYRLTAEPGEESEDAPPGKKVP